jgi:hypothetical protein
MIYLEVAERRNDMRQRRDPLCRIQCLLLILVNRRLMLRLIQLRRINQLIHSQNQRIAHHIAQQAHRVCLDRVLTRLRNRVRTAPRQQHIDRSVPSPECRGARVVHVLRERTPLVE